MASSIFIIITMNTQYTDFTVLDILFLGFIFMLIFILLITLLFCLIDCCIQFFLLLKNCCLKFKSKKKIQSNYNTLESNRSLTSLTSLFATRWWIDDKGLESGAWTLSCKKRRTNCPIEDRLRCAIYYPGKCTW